MRVIVALKTLWGALRHPTVTSIQNSSVAVAIVAAAVILLSSAYTVTALLESSNPDIARQSMQSSVVEQLRLHDTQSNVENASTTAGRAFTAQLGVSLITTIVGLALVALLLMLLTPFLTDQPVSYVVAMAAVSSSALIEMARLALYLPLHLLTGSMQWGFHAGAFVSIVDHPFLFTWLAKIDPIVWWQYVVMAMVLSNSIGLHYRYGLVIGTIVYLVMVAGIGSLALLAFVAVMSM